MMDDLLVAALVLVQSVAVVVAVIVYVTTRHARWLVQAAILASLAAIGVVDLLIIPDSLGLTVRRFIGVGMFVHVCIMQPWYLRKAFIGLVQAARGTLP